MIRAEDLNERKRKDDPFGLAARRRSNKEDESHPSHISPMCAVVPHLEIERKEGQGKRGEKNDCYFSPSPAVKRRPL